MIHTGYLILMSGIVAVVALISVPSLFWPRCVVCNHRNWVARNVCHYCEAPLPDDLDL